MQRSSRISSNTGGIRRCGSKRIRIPDPNKYKTKHTITKFCNLKIKWPKSMWNVENGVGLANSTKLFAPEYGPLNQPKRHWRTRLRIPEVSAISTIVGWRPLSFGWRPFHGLHPQCHFQSYTRAFQGSCLGPFLFNIASNDISCYVLSDINGFRVKVVRYADDTQIAITGPRNRLSEMCNSLESVLDTLGTWFMQNGMMANARKTELILCGDRRQPSRIEESPVISFMETAAKMFDNCKKPRCNF